MAPHVTAVDDSGCGHRATVYWNVVGRGGCSASTFLAFVLSLHIMPMRALLVPQQKNAVQVRGQRKVEDAQLHFPLPRIATRRFYQTESPKPQTLHSPKAKVREI